MDPSRLVEVLKLGSAASNALTYLNGLITLENVDHLAADETAEIRLFGTAMTENGVNADAATARPGPCSYSYSRCRTGASTRTCFGMRAPELAGCRRMPPGHRGYLATTSR
jgi:hypothetical protein